VSGSDIDAAIQRTMGWMTRLPGEPSAFPACQLYPGRDCPGCERTCARVMLPIDDEEDK
jgi:hypothetical protein